MIPMEPWLKAIVLMNCGQYYQHFHNLKFEIGIDFGDYFTHLENMTTFMDHKDHKNFIKLMA